MVIVQWVIKTDRGPFRKFSNADTQERILFDCIENLYGFEFLHKERVSRISVNELTLSVAGNFVLEDFHCNEFS